MMYKINMRSPGFHPLQALRGTPAVTTGVAFGILLALFLLSGCASTRLPRVAPVPVDQFEPFLSETSGQITPGSVKADIPDVDILALSDEMKALVDTSVSIYRDPTRRMNTLAEILSQRVRYDTVKDRYGIKTARETFETGTGNCLSFSNMFVAMARYAGLTAQYQEIPTPPNWARTGEVLFFTLHIGSFVDILNRPDYTVQLFGGQADSVVVWNSATRYMFTPSELGLYNPEANPFSARPIPDHRAFAQYYNNIGSMHLAEGRNEEAFRYFIKAIDMDPKLNFAWSNLGVVYSRNNQFSAAEEAYRQGLSVSRGPDDVTVMTIMGNMSRLYRRKGDVETADYYENEVASFRQRNPYYHYAAAKIAFDNHLYEESVRHFKDAIERKDDDHLFYYGLALAYFKLGDMKNVEKNLERAKRYAWDDAKKNYYDRVWEELSGGDGF